MTSQNSGSQDADLADMDRGSRRELGSFCSSQVQLGLTRENVLPLSHRTRGDCGLEKDKMPHAGSQGFSGGFTVPLHWR